MALWFPQSQIHGIDLQQKNILLNIEHCQIHHYLTGILFWEERETLMRWDTRASLHKHYGPSLSSLTHFTSLPCDVQNTDGGQEFLLKKQSSSHYAVLNRFLIDQTEEQTRGVFLTVQDCCSQSCKNASSWTTALQPLFVGYEEQSQIMPLCVLITPSDLLYLALFM